MGREKRMEAGGRQRDGEIEEEGSWREREEDES